MMTIGDPDLWSDTFPEDLVPRLLDLIADTWSTFEKPSPSDREVPITRRFKHALKQAKDLNRLPVRLEREPAEDDPETGEELGRIDLKFLPALSAREEVYLAFECKRLNAIVNGSRRSLVSEYVTEGVMRFVTGQYARAVRHGGMLGYILSGDCDAAIRAIGDNIASRAAALCMDDPAVLSRSRFRPAVNCMRETQHNLHSSRHFILHHMFLACANKSPTGIPRGAPRVPERG